MDTHVNIYLLKIHILKLHKSCLNCDQTKQFNCNLAWLYGEYSFTLKNDGLSQSEQWWHDINVIKSCRVTLRTFPPTFHPPRYILAVDTSSWTVKYFQSQDTLQVVAVTAWQWWADVTAVLCLAVTHSHMENVNVRQVE